jgi:hypothetical protein
MATEGGAESGYPGPTRVDRPHPAGPASPGRGLAGGRSATGRQVCMRRGPTRPAACTEGPGWPGDRARSIKGTVDWSVWYERGCRWRPPSPRPMSRGRQGPYKVRGGRCATLRTLDGQVGHDPPWADEGSRRAWRGTVGLWGVPAGTIDRNIDKAAQGVRARTLRRALRWPRAAVWPFPVACSPGDHAGSTSDLSRTRLTLRAPAYHDHRALPTRPAGASPPPPGGTVPSRSEGPG